MTVKIINLTGSRFTYKDKLLVMSEKDCLARVIGGRKTPCKCGQHHPMGWDPGLYEMEKLS